jgi:hypothetical protein
MFTYSHLAPCIFCFVLFLVCLIKNSMVEHVSVWWSSSQTMMPQPLRTSLESYQHHVKNKYNLQCGWQTGPTFQSENCAVVKIFVTPLAPSWKFRPLKKKRSLLPVISKNLSHTISSPPRQKTRSALTDFSSSLGLCSLHLAQQRTHFFATISPLLHAWTLSLASVSWDLQLKLLRLLERCHLHLSLQVTLSIIPLWLLV